MVCDFWSSCSLFITCCERLPWKLLALSFSSVCSSLSVSGFVLPGISVKGCLDGEKCAGFFGERDDKTLPTDTYSAYQKHNHYVSYYHCSYQFRKILSRNLSSFNSQDQIMKSPLKLLYISL